MTKYIYKISLLGVFLLVSFIGFGQQNLPTSGAISGTYTLTTDITLTGTLSVAAGKSATINLNGFTIDRKGTVAQDFVFLVSGTLYLNGNGTIKGGRGDRGGCALISGTVYLDGPTIQECIATQGNYGTVPDQDSDIINYYTQGCGGAFFINQGGKLYFKSGVIKNCRTEKYNGNSINTTDRKLSLGRGGAIFVDAEQGADPGYFEMSGGTIEYCSANIGGAVYVHKSLNKDGEKVNGTFKMTGGTIKGNTAGYGFGVYVAGTFDMTGGSITENKAYNLKVGWSYPNGNNLPDYGGNSSFGGVYTEGVEGSPANFNFTGGTISRNVASSGGGVMVWTHSVFIMNGADALISENCAAGNAAGSGVGNGGAVYVQGGTFNLMNGKLIGNRAVRYGGAVNTNQSATFTISGNTEISENIANYGGGFSQEQGACTMSLNGSGIKIKNNIAKNNGGGIMIEKGTLSIKSATISNNSAGAKGGGVSFYVSRIHGDVKVDIDESAVISSNAAVESGGGIDIYVNPNSSADISEDKEDDQLDDDIGVNSVIVNLDNGQLQSNTSYNGAGINVYINAETITTSSTKKNEATINLGTSTTTPTISSNIASENGGGIAMNSGTFNIVNANISSNSADDNGGGIYLGDGTFKVSGLASLSGNSATNGGGIYVGNGTFTVTENGNINAATNHVSGIAGNDDTGNGGAIYLAGGNLTSSGATTLTGNYSSNSGGAVYVEGGNITLNNPSITNNGKNGSTVTTKKGGAIYLTGTGKNFNATGTSEIKNNASIEAGGAIYVNGGNINMAASTLQGNTSTDGGAAYVYNGNFTTTGATGLSGNHSTNDGGALYVSGGTVNLNTPTIGTNTATNNGGAIYSTGSVTLNGTSSMTNNTAKNGGAIYTTGTVTLNGTSSMTNNTAKNGGAIYTTGTVTLKGNSTMTGNNVTEVSGDGGNGGAIYVNGGSIVSKDGSTYYAVEATNNSAKNGGVFYVNGSIDLGYTVLQNNTASGNGGAVALINGTFSMANDDGAGNASTIKGNKAVNGFGGGLYMSSNAANIGAAPVINWTGGVFDGNEAKAGGAVAADGFIKLAFAATMENNIAKIGGGLYLSNGVDMKFADGLIRNNSASTTNTTYNTASGEDATTVEGVGGGIFMSGAEGKTTTLDFTNTEKFGIYNNVATNAAADICVNGKNTEISLPNVSELELKGFDVPGSKLYWMEDYFTGESYKSNSTNPSYEGTTVTGYRYENLLQGELTLIDKYIIDLDTKIPYTNTYLCLDLGYDLVFVDLIVKGLDAGDVAAINCKYPDNSGYTLYRKVLFTGKADNQSVTRKVALPSGYWKFEASDWSFQYTDPVFYRGTETVSHIGDIFISRKDNDVDANDDPVLGFRQVTANFGTVPTPDPGQPDVGKVKQFQKTVVNRMKRN